MQNTTELKFPEKIAYASGQLSISLLNQVVVMWAMYRYAPPEGKGATLVPIALAGMVMTIGRIVDAVTDPLVAYISDRLKTPWGRRKPLIAVGAPFLFAFFYLLWTPPGETYSQTANFIYFALIMGLFWAAYTVPLIPYMSLLPEIAVTSHERVNVSTWVAVFIIIGMMSGFLGSSYLIENFSYRTMGLIFGAVSLVFYYIVALFVKERVQVTSEYSKINIVSAVGATLKNRPFPIYLFARFSFEFGWNMLAGGMTYMVTVILGESEGAVGLYLAPVLVAAFLSFPFVTLLSDRIGKKKLFLLTMVVIAVLLSLMFFIGKFPISLPLKMQGYIVMMLMGPPMACFFILPNAILADIVDYDEKMTGLRREGMYFGVQGLVMKTGISFSATAVGFLFAAFGYSKDNDLGIRLLGPVAGACIFLAFILFLFYPLGEKK
ncbi:MAG: MFS transporter [bacterium]